MGQFGPNNDDIYPMHGAPSLRQPGSNNAGHVGGCQIRPIDRLDPVAFSHQRQGEQLPWAFGLRPGSLAGPHDRLLFRKGKVDPCSDGADLVRPASTTSFPDEGHYSSRHPPRRRAENSVLGEFHRSQNWVGGSELLRNNVANLDHV